MIVLLFLAQKAYLIVNYNGVTLSFRENKTVVQFCYQNVIALSHITVMSLIMVYVNTH